MRPPRKEDRSTEQAVVMAQIHASFVERG